MSPSARWPEEYEALRAESREVSAAIVGGITTGREDGEAVGDMARRMREGMELLLPKLADHLLDDTLFMAARWEAWGNEVELAVYPDATHGFLRWPVALAERGRSRITDFLAGCFDGVP